MTKPRLTLLCLLLAIVSSLYSQRQKVNLNLYYFQKYCGGAAPTKEMVADAEKPKAYANRMVYLVSDKGKVDSVKTNKKGQATVKLEPGVYKLFEGWRYYRKAEKGPLSNCEHECLKTEWAKESYLVTVNKTGKAKVTEKNRIVFNCDWSYPCLKEELRILPE